RPVCHLGQKVIHHTKKWRCQKESDSIVSIPPLYQCILHTGIDIEALPYTYRKLDRIDNMQYRNSDKCGNIEPYRHVHVAFTTFNDRTEHVDTEDYPDDRNSDVDRPFHLRILMRCRVTQRKGYGRCDNDKLPSPEMDLAQH